MSSITYSLILAAILIAILLSNAFYPFGTSMRLVYNLFFFGAVTLIFFLGLSLLGLYKDGKFLSKKVFLTLTSMYTIVFIAMGVTYFLTGQIVRAQTLLFSYKVYTGLRLTLTYAPLILGLILIVFLLNGLILFRQPADKEKRLAKRFFIGAIILLFCIVFFVRPMLNTSNPLVQSYSRGDVVLIEVDEIESQRILETASFPTTPNVIFVLLESITAEKLGVYGYERNATPNLDSLAKRSILFQNAYATATHSDYAQPGYLSSNYILENDYRTMFSESHDGDFPWDLFKEAGYDTAYISSQDDSWAGMGNYYTYDSLDKYQYSLSDGAYDYGSGLAKKDFDENTMDDVLEWINSSITACRPVPDTDLKNTTYSIKCENNLDRSPFFLYTNLQGTHKPFVYPSDFEFYSSNPDSSSIEVNTNKYDNSLRHVDFQVGRLIDYLKNAGILNETVIIISADHGDDLYGRHGFFGHGYSIYNEEINVPLMFYVPGQAPHAVSEPVSHIDLLPSVFHILGMNGSDDFRGKPFERENRLIFYTQNHKYMIGTLKDDLKIIIDLNRNLVEVYNITEDPLELNNLNRGYVYGEEILELLTWHYCQLNYFSVDEKPESLEKYCKNF